MQFIVETTHQGKQVTFSWNSSLECDDKDALMWLKWSMKMHIPKVIAVPDMIDYSDDLSNMMEVYRAIVDTFPNVVVKKAPPEDEFDPDVIY